VTGRLPAFFSNLLPEGHLREYLAAQAGVQSHREFFLLAALGADLPGALTITPMEPAAESSSESAAITPLVNVSRKERRSGSRLRECSSSSRPLWKLRVASRFLPAVSVVHGSSNLPSSQFASVPENEYAMLALARAVGIEVPRTELIDVSEIHGLPADAGAMEGKALAIQRFDRGTAGEGIHMEDFAQVFGLYPQDKYHHRSYANIAAVLWAETGEVGAYEFFRRLVFSVLIGKRRHAPEELVASISGPAHAGVVASLRLCRYIALHSERHPSAHFWRQPEFEWNHRRPSPPIRRHRSPTYEPLMAHRHRGR